jgi:hypothetical protein
MKIQFVTAQIDLDGVDGSLLQAIEAALKIQGEPLRWAITAVESETALIEAVVLQELNASTGYQTVFQPNQS